MLQKVRSARRKLFPQMGACLPTYQPTPTEYNEGIYRVVSPAMKVNKTSSPSTIPTSVSPPSSGTLGSRPLSPDSPPKELVRPIFLHCISCDIEPIILSHLIAFDDVYSLYSAIVCNLSILNAYMWIIKTDGLFSHDAHTCTCIMANGAN